MDTIITATGKVFETDMVASIPSPPYIYIRLLNTDLTTAQKVFGNPKETSALQYRDMRILNHTKLGYAYEEDNAIKVRLEA